MDLPVSHPPTPADPSPVPAATERTGAPPLIAWIRLARPKQWTKGAFVLLGALYSQKLFVSSGLWAAIAAFFAFGFAASACYVFNDLHDVAADRTHPRKRHRPIAAGLIPPRQAALFGVFLLALSVLSIWLLPLNMLAQEPLAAWAKLLLLGTVVLYVVNTAAYTVWLKHIAVADVMSLALGFVLRVLGGCAAVAVEPSTWLLNCTFFLAMFLAFGKRLGERRALGDVAAAARSVQAQYTLDLLRMATVVTAVATLLTYAGYVQDQAPLYTRGFNLLWLTILPATFGLLRCMLMVDRGAYDDPTELATRDRPFQLAGLVFAAMTVTLMVLVRPAAA